MNSESVSCRVHISRVTWCTAQSETWGMLAKIQRIIHKDIPPLRSTSPDLTPLTASSALAHTLPVFGTGASSNGVLYALRCA